MIRFIWRNWWKNKERFLLLLVGALIVSSGLSYLVGLSHSSKGTITETLQKEWESSYDIVVRPPGTRTKTEKEQGLVEPNYLNSHSGGISLDQYHTIQKIDGISIAAPIAVMGYALLGFHTVENVPLNQPGIYQRSVKIIADNGPKKIITDQYSDYFFRGQWAKPASYPPTIEGSNQFAQDYGVSFGDFEKFYFGKYALIVGIDPKAESKLVGLDEAVLSYGNGRYFQPDDQVTTSKNSTGAPVLFRQKSLLNRSIIVQFKRLDLPFKNAEVAEKTMNKVKRNGGKEFLSQVQGKPLETYTYDSRTIHKVIIEGITGLNPYTGKPVKKENGKPFQFHNSALIMLKASSLSYDKIKSPFPQKWHYAYGLNTFSGGKHLTFKTETFRPEILQPHQKGWPTIKMNFIGLYDPKKLNLSKDPLNELPMETYRPPTTRLVLDAQGNPANPPKRIVPTGKPFGLLTPPPTILTTIEAAQALVKGPPISAIRIRVSGVEEMNEASQAKLERIAGEIREKTGLITDITLGSSPQPVLIHVPSINDRPELGWVNEPWINIGAAITIFRESSLGFSGIIASVMLVAIMYVLATNLVSLLSRKKQFAVLLAIGWRPSQLVRMMFTESLIVGCFVAVVAWGMLAVVGEQSGESISGVRFLAVGLFGLLIYLLGAIWPARLAAKIAPYEAIQGGEISKNARRIKRTRGVFSMAFSHLLGKMSRNVLSILAIAVPTTLLTFFIFITFRLKGILYTTWLGQYISVQIDTAHYIAMGIALLVAILTTAEIMWQNVSERKEEISLLKAIGWRNGAIRRLILLEGFFSGIMAGIIGVGLAMLIVWGLYDKFPLDNLWLLISCGIIPLVIGILGAALPAEIAVHMSPSRGMRGSYMKKSTGNWLVVVVILLLIILFAGLAFLITHFTQ